LFRKCPCPGPSFEECPQPGGLPYTKQPQILVGFVKSGAYLVQYPASWMGGWALPFKILWE